MVSPDQAGLFDDRPAGPEGFSYWREFLSADEERGLAGRLAGLPFENFQFHGHLGNRRVVSYGWRYDFAGRGSLHKVDDVPAFLLPPRERAARLAGLEASAFQHVLVTEYGPGAGIGWHKDKAVFDEVFGVSLLAACDFRFRRARGGGTWERYTVVAEPRSAYLLRGAARTEWEHSIPPVDALRYSITFRSVRAAAGAA
jgi:alkylated DNA repair dioxygenase AlkB